MRTRALVGLALLALSAVAAPAAGTNRRRRRRPSSGSRPRWHAGRRHGAVRRARSEDAVGSDDDPEVPPRGLRHRAQQLPGRARARPREEPLRARRHGAVGARAVPHRHRARAAPHAGAAGAGDSARRRRARRRAGDGGARRRPRVPLARGEDGGWGFAGPRQGGRGRQEPRATTISRSCARAPPTTSGRPRARRNDPQADARASGQRAAVVAGRRPLAPAAARRAGHAAAGAGGRGAAHLFGHRDPARGAADAGEPVRRRARRRRDLRAQALGTGTPLLLPQGRRGAARLRAVLARGRRG